MRLKTLFEKLLETVEVINHEELLPPRWKILHAVSAYRDAIGMCRVIQQHNPTQLNVGARNTKRKLAAASTPAVTTVRFSIN